MKNRRKILEGQVVSTKMKKTIVVRVERVKKHTLYKKNFRIYKKFKAHDKREEASLGDLVRIIESRPYSKEKHFRLLEIVKRKQL